MHNKADEYRRNAADCLRMAERTADSTARATLLDMAQSWRALAEQAERNSANDLVYETPPRSPLQQPVAQQQQQIQPDQEPEAEDAPVSKEPPKADC
jgi:hypothetical protein